MHLPEFPEEEKKFIDNALEAIDKQLKDKIEWKDPKLPTLEEKVLKDLENRFKWHTPKDDATGKAHGKIRDLCLDAAKTIAILVPKGREQSLAFTHLEEVMMWANAGIARNGS